MDEDDLLSETLLRFWQITLKDDDKRVSDYALLRMIYQTAALDLVRRATSRKRGGIANQIYIDLAEVIDPKAAEPFERLVFNELIASFQPKIQSLIFNESSQHYGVQLSASSPALLGVAREFQEATKSDHRHDPFGKVERTGDTDHLGTRTDFKWDVPNGDSIDCTAFAPRFVVAGATVLLQVFVHSIARRDEALRLACEFDSTAVTKGRRAVGRHVEVGTTFAFDITLGGATADTDRETLVWRGETAQISFLVAVNSREVPQSVSGRILISIEGVPIGHIKFVIPVQSVEPKSGAGVIGVMHWFRSFFVSYASKDRSKVLKRLHLPRLMGMKFRQDVLDLDPGDRWEHRLYEFIRECDTTLLFWSTHAKKSKWVLKECQYCIEHKGIDRLLPVIIEKPPPLPPPELAEIHMNDKLLYFMD